MNVVHKVTRTVYTAYQVERKCTIWLDLAQTIDLGPGDVIVEYMDEDGMYKTYTMMDALSFAHNFEVLSDTGHQTLI